MPPEGSAAHKELPTLVPGFEASDFARESEVQRHAASEKAEPTIEQARRLHAAGDHERALFLLARLLELEPLHSEVEELLAECRVALERDCLAAIGSETAVLVPGVSTEDLKSFALDSVSGFLVSLIDGTATAGDLLDVAGLPRLLALRHLRNLMDRGIICVGSGEMRASKHDRPSLPAWYGALEVKEDASVESGAPPWRMSTPTLDAVPVLLVPPEELEALDLDPRARALLTHIDEKATVEEILLSTRAGLVEGIGLFERLAESGIVAFA